jgi:ubiquinone/menaquinone biosynthesis C-methylase UbiE
MHQRRYPGSPSGLRSPQRLERLQVDEIVDRCLQGITARTALDVGTGSGVFAEAFASRRLKVAGVDANPRMLPLAQEYVPDGEFRLARAESLPFPDASFDLVFMGLLLHETDDRIQALREARRVARARVAIFEWPYLEEGQGPPLAHRLRPDQVVELAERAGLPPPQVSSLGHMALYLSDLPRGDRL